MEQSKRNMDPQVLSDAAFDAMCTTIRTKCPNMPFDDAHRRKLVEYYGDDQEEGQVNHFKRWLEARAEKAKKEEDNPKVKQKKAKKQK
jgi:hypothetical protein